MDEKWRRILGVLLFSLALSALLLYRPVLRVAGIDLDRTVPDWAGFFTPGQYKAFLGEVRSYFRAKELAIRIDAEKVYPEDGEEYGLRYVAQKCHRARRSDWAAIISEHFDRLLGQPVKPEPAQEKGLRARPSS